MGILSIVLSIPLAWLFGTLLGHALRSIAPEEQKPLNRSLQILSKASFYSVLALCTIFLALSQVMISPIGKLCFILFLGICSLLLIKKYRSAPLENMILGICSAISSINHYALFFSLSIISLYFCCQGALLPKKKPILPLLLGSYQMPAIGILLTSILFYFL